MERIGVYAGHGGGGGLGYGRGDGGLHELETRAAVRFQSLEAAAAALDALDGRHFDTRPLRAAFDDGTYAARLAPTRRAADALWLWRRGGGVPGLAACAAARRCGGRAESCV